MKRKLGDPLRVKHIIDAISTINFFLTGRSESDLFNDKLLLSAIERQLEIIGEASNHVSAETRALNPSIPWRQMVDFRNVIAHEYFAVDVYLISDIVFDKLPKIEPELLLLYQSLLPKT